MRIHRLQSAKDFRTLFRYGRYFESSFFKLVARQNTLPYDRFAFIAPKTVDKRAVVRNRLRRRAREWMLAYHFPARSPLDVAVLFKKEVVTATKANFYEELSRIIRRSIG